MEVKIAISRLKAINQKFKDHELSTILLVYFCSGVLFYFEGHKVIVAS